MSPPLAGLAPAVPRSRPTTRNGGRVLPLTTAPWEGAFHARKRGSQLQPLADAPALPTASGEHLSRVNMALQRAGGSINPPTTVRVASNEEVSIVCRGMRTGQVLRKQTILKADHFPSCYNTSLPEQIEGAPNFRSVHNMPVYGLGAPTLRGLRNVCERVAAKGETVVWFNLREEPVVYIHGRPFCVKDRDQPFKNLENVGIARTNVDQAEMLLKKEVLAEAERYGGALLVTDETKPAEGGVAAWGEAYSYWEVGINEHSVCTVRELYQQLRAEGVHNVRYHRVPITDESPPMESDFDIILNCMGRSAEGMAFVFNCQLGRGRTTTGMAISCIIWREIAGQGFNPEEWDVRNCRLLKATLPGDDAGAAHEPEPDLQWGEYKAVRQLVPRLVAGASRKQFVDCAINKCSQMQNLREDIMVKKARAETHPSAKRREQVRAGTLVVKGRQVVNHVRARAAMAPQELLVGLRYLERYIYLILFTVYVSMTYDTHSSLYQQKLQSLTFKEWIEGQHLSNDLYTILDSLTLN